MKIRRSTVKDYEKELELMNDDDGKDAAELRETFERERIADLAQKEKNEEVLRAMEVTLQSLRLAKPNDRGELARRYAVAITEYEKSLAFFKFYVVEQN
jgi:hypothetical protein